MQDIRTQHYNLRLTAEDDITNTFKDYRLLMNGNNAENSDIGYSNIQLIDQALHTLDGRIDDLSYEPISITAFSASPSQKEIGSSASNVVLSWSLSKIPVSIKINNNTLTAPEGGWGTSGTWTDSGTYSADKTWTLEVTDAGGVSIAATTVSRNTILYFRKSVYYAAATIPATMDSAFLLTMSSDLAASKAKTFTVNAGVNQYIWYAIPAAFGTCNFSVGGFEGGFELVNTIQHTNASGHTESYYVYRSTNDGLGSTRVTVS